MSNLPVQTVNTAWQQPLKKHRQPLRNHRLGDRHQLDFKTRHWVRFLKQENYHLISLEKLTSEGVKSGGCETYISLIINHKNLFFYRERPTEDYFLERQKDYLFAHLFWREREELNEVLEKSPRRFRKKWQEIKVKVEVLSQWNHPTKLVSGYKENGRPKPSWEGGGWNSPNYWEPKNRSFGNVWEENVVPNSKRKHPHQKPRELIKALISATTNEKDLVVDPCAGSFIVLEVCQELNRKFLGCDLTFKELKER